jgi:hypothetical protein
MVAERKDADPLEGVFDGEYERQKLLVLLASRYALMLSAVNKLVQEGFGLAEAPMRLDDPAVRHFILTEAVTRVVRIDATTQAALRVMIARGQELGLSSWEISNGTADGSYPGIQGLFAETWKSRPVTVARTEMQHAALRSAYNRYAATGMVTGVEARDGGTTDSDDICNQRNGRTYPMNLPPPELAHPNCTLVLVPVIDPSLVRRSNTGGQ